MKIKLLLVGVFSAVSFSSPAFSAPGRFSILEACDRALAHFDRYEADLEQMKQLNSKRALPNLKLTELKFKIIDVESSQRSIFQNCYRLEEFERIANTQGKKIYNENLNRTIELKPKTVDWQTEEKTISELEKHLLEYEERWDILQAKISEVIDYFR